VLLIMATIVLLIGLWGDEPWLKAAESLSVVFAVLLSTMIIAFCEWGKDKQMLRLRKEIQNEKITVLRGQYGTSQEVLVSELVVGDVVLLNGGDRVPADCLLLEEMDMQVDQREFFNNEEEGNATK